MRKILLITMAVLLLISSSACSILTREIVTEPEIKPDFFVAEPLAVPSTVPVEDAPDAEDEEDISQGIIEPDGGQTPVLPEDDPLYEPVTHMYEGLIPIFRYFAFEGKDYDLTNLDPNDFWLFMAMIAANVNGDSVDQTGDINLSWDKVSEYAESFFPEYYAAKGIPDWRDTYSAYADPRSQSISLHSMAVDGYEGKMVGFCESQEYPGCYETVLEISWMVISGAADSDNLTESRRWNIVLEPFDDNEEEQREFAYKLVSFEPETEE